MTDERQAIRFQMRVLALVVFYFAGSLAAAQWFANHGEILLDHRLAEWKQTNGMYRDGRFYFDPEGRLLNETLPGADYRRGGVYLTGASGLQTAVQPWKLPPEEQALFHNYCFSGATHTQQLQFFRYLVEQDGLLRAGGEKTSVIIGLFFGDAAHPETANPISIFRYLFTMDGLYSYDAERGIERVPRSPAMLRLRLARNRNQAFWRWAALETVGGGFDYLRPVHRMPADDNRSFWLKRLGKDWEAGMDLEVEQLGRLIDFLQARSVTVHAIYLPLASWTSGFPPFERYREKVDAVLSARSVPIEDLTRKVPDSDFSDSAHLGYAGAQVTDPVIMEIARQDLRRMRLLP